MKEAHHGPLQRLLDGSWGARRVKTDLVPDARNILKRIEHVAAVVEPHSGDLRQGAGVSELAFLEGVVIPPRASKILKPSSWHDADLRPNGIEFLVRRHSASLDCRLTVKLRGRTTTPDSGRGPAISTGSRGRKQTTPHGPLQRLLEVAPGASLTSRCPHLGGGASDRATP